MVARQSVEQVDDLLTEVQLTMAELRAGLETPTVYGDLRKQSVWLLEQMAIAIDKLLDERLELTRDTE